jgi:hypothetical protein
LIAGWYDSIPVGGSRNEGTALKRSASHLDKQMILKLTGYKRNLRKGTLNEPEKQSATCFSGSLT